MLMEHRSFIEFRYTQPDFLSSSVILLAFVQFIDH